MKTLYLFILLLVILSSVSFSAISNEKSFRTCSIINPKQSKDTSYKIISVWENFYCYEILLNQKVVIRQTTIPGIAGNKGFVSKRDAEKVARLVLDKLSKGIMPPTISKQDLSRLKIKY